jgi:hypothetical protein
MELMYYTKMQMKLIWALRLLRKREFLRCQNTFLITGNLKDFKNIKGFRLFKFDTSIVKMVQKFKKFAPMKLLRSLVREFVLF